MKKYTAVLFDLDHTLWDYETNSLEALTEVHKAHDLANYAGLTVERFIENFHRVNHKLWDSYNKGMIDRSYIKNYRFQKILEKSSVSDSDLSSRLSEQYISTCQLKTNLMPYTIETLDNLSDKYTMYILTNGFDDVQYTKLKNSGLSHYFSGMVTSETCGHRKPSKEIFEYTLDKADVTSEEAIMIGDNLSTDIGGAQNAGIDTIYFNPKKVTRHHNASYEIACLSELTNIL